LLPGNGGGGDCPGEPDPACPAGVQPPLERAAARRAHRRHDRAGGALRGGMRAGHLPDPGPRHLHRIGGSLMVGALLALSLVAAPSRPGRAVWAELQARWRPRLEPLLTEVLRFPTVHGDQEALARQRRWLAQVAPELGLVVRDRETMTEVELPGPEGAPVLGLVVHGDLQPVNAAEWTVPPFSGTVKNGEVWGRGAVDDEGPLVQALLAMAALKSSGIPRTHTVRLLVGTDEEGGGSDLEEYRKRYALPDLSLVLDSDFTVVVGEKAWAEW